ncbi:MAG: rod shape-determining protein MreD [Thermoanaerobacteraceae bacterium]|nr:rod shape-determining protein MreD [Thermoanaerobacteraceae bacterium]
MRTVCYILVLGALFLLQTTLSNFIWIFGLKPDLPLVFALCIAAVNGEKAGAVTGLLNGFLEDILFGSFIGPSTIAKSAAAYLVGYGSRNLYKGLTLITMAIAFAGTVIFNLILVIVAYLTGELVYPWHQFLSITIPSALLNMLISPLIYKLVVNIERFIDFYFNIKY